VCTRPLCWSEWRPGQFPMGGRGSPATGGIGPSPASGTTGASGSAVLGLGSSAACLGASSSWRVLILSNLEKTFCSGDFGDKRERAPGMDGREAQRGASPTDRCFQLRVRHLDRRCRRCFPCGFREVVEDGGRTCHVLRTTGRFLHYERGRLTLARP
jgi:hypothetical protein